MPEDCGIFRDYFARREVGEPYAEGSYIPDGSLWEDFPVDEKNEYYPKTITDLEELRFILNGGELDGEDLLSTYRIPAIEAVVRQIRIRGVLIEPNRNIR